MLEAKGLFRKYCPKKGQPVVALNDVSIKFPSAGLIFILGKSGSGKSTLLNVMGGLDKCDKGEIIIKGKSSKDFSQSDFDSYRNTYLGFIFQEYNILDEFNVGQNIALALELQGKKASTEEINRILKEVDLVGYGSRKTNELSGGQKQRVAIARALVKNPEIIFADEPTGALDSKTGIAVFDTLKKLSKDKLVVVVSHDREFAEQYGDRVIELADGKIISDIEKTRVEGNQVNKGITVIDDKVIRIGKDYVLTPEDMEVIREYLNKVQGERMISLDGKINDAVRSSARIDNDGNSESFIKTDESKIVLKQEEFRSIHSKLSLRHCFRIGSSSLKVKPFRLIITIILSIVAFGMFGLSDTMGSYDKVTATISSMRDEHLSSFALMKKCYVKHQDWSTSETVHCGDEDIKFIKDQYGLDAKGVYYFSEYGGSAFLNCFQERKESSNYYVTQVNGLVDSSLAELQGLGFELLAGSYPENLDEILITEHLYKSFEQYGYQSETESIKAKDMTKSALIGKTISTTINNNDAKLKISGIVDTHFDSTRYEKLKTKEPGMELGYYMLLNQYQSEYNYGYHGLFFTNKTTVQSIIDNKLYAIKGSLTATVGDIDANVSSFRKYSGREKNILMLNGKDSPAADEITYSMSLAEKYYNANHRDLDDPVSIQYDGKEPLTVYDYSTLLNQMNSSFFVEPFAHSHYEEAIGNGMDIYSIYSLVEGEAFDPSDGKTISEEEAKELYGTYLKNAYQMNEDVNTYVTSTTFEDYYMDKANTYLKPLLEQILSNMPSMSLETFTWNDAESVKFSLKPVGLYLPTRNEWNTPTYVSDAFLAAHDLETGQYGFLVCPMPRNANLLESIVRSNYKTPSETNPVVYRMQSSVTPSFELINDIIESLATVFLYLGIGFAIFASLMLFNFITISISYKKREIGILRAVGARSKDVFNVFFAESFIISMISYVFAIIATFVVSFVINATLRSNANLAITILTPGIRQIALVLLVTFFVALISTFLPVYKIAMKKPIDAIRDR